VDAGHAGWKSPKEMARLLVAGGIAWADGFSLNVSNFEWTSKNVAYGDAVVAELAKLGVTGKQFVVDTGRNGAGPGVDKWGLGTWGDPEHARGGGPIKNGPLPTTHTGNNHAAAFLWVKAPGYGDNRTRPAERFGGAAWVAPEPRPAQGP
jgi:endoglucanase